MSVNITVASTRSGSGRARAPVQKLLDVANHGFPVACPGQTVDPPELHVPGAWDLRGQLLARPSIDGAVAAPVEHEGWEFRGTAASR